MTTPMTAGRRADTARRRQKITAAIADTIRDGGELSVAAVARRAGVDRSTLYRHRDLLAHLHLAQTTAASSGDPRAAVSRASLHADLANTTERNRRLHARNQQLERALSAHLGQQAWQESGLGAPADVESLQRTITALEQQVVALRAQLDERDQDLAAARAANRTLMAQLNAPSR